MRMETSSIEIGSSASITARVDRQGAGDGDALALTAGQLVRELVGVLRLQADRAEQLGHLGAGRGSAAAPCGGRAAAAPGGSRRCGPG